MFEADALETADGRRMTLQPVVGNSDGIHNPLEISKRQKLLFEIPDGRIGTPEWFRGYSRIVLEIVKGVLLKRAAKKFIINISFLFLKKISRCI